MEGGDPTSSPGDTGGGGGARHPVAPTPPLQHAAPQAVAAGSSAAGHTHAAPCALAAGSSAAGHPAAPREYPGLSARIKRIGAAPRALTAGSSAPASAAPLPLADGSSASATDTPPQQASMDVEGQGKGPALAKSSASTSSLATRPTPTSSLAAYQKATGRRESGIAFGDDSFRSPSRPLESHDESLDLAESTARLSLGGAAASRRGFNGTGDEEAGTPVAVLVRKFPSPASGVSPVSRPSKTSKLDKPLTLLDEMEQEDEGVASDMDSADESPFRSGRAATPEPFLMYNEDDPHFFGDYGDDFVDEDEFGDDDRGDDGAADGGRGGAGGPGGGTSGAPGGGTDGGDGDGDGDDGDDPDAGDGAGRRRGPPRPPRRGRGGGGGGSDDEDGDSGDHGPPTDSRGQRQDNHHKEWAIMAKWLRYMELRAADKWARRTDVRHCPVPLHYLEVEQRKALMDDYENIVVTQALETTIQFVGDDMTDVWYVIVAGCGTSYRRITSLITDKFDGLENSDIYYVDCIDVLKWFPGDEEPAADATCFIRANTEDMDAIVDDIDSERGDFKNDGSSPGRRVVFMHDSALRPDGFKRRARAVNEALEPGDLIVLVQEVDEEQKDEMDVVDLGWRQVYEFQRRAGCFARYFSQEREIAGLPNRKFTLAVLEKVGGDSREPRWAVEVPKPEPLPYFDGYHDGMVYLLFPEYVNDEGQARTYAYGGSTYGQKGPADAIAKRRFHAHAQNMIKGQHHSELVQFVYDQKREGGEITNRQLLDYEGWRKVRERKRSVANDTPLDPAFHGGIKGVFEVKLHEKRRIGESVRGFQIRIRFFEQLVVDRILDQGEAYCYNGTERVLINSSFCQARAGFEGRVSQAWVRLKEVTRGKTKADFAGGAVVPPFMITAVALWEAERLRDLAQEEEKSDEEAALELCQDIAQGDVEEDRLLALFVDGLKELRRTVQTKKDIASKTLRDALFSYASLVYHPYYLGMVERFADHDLTVGQMLIAGIPVGTQIDSYDYIRRRLKKAQSKGGKAATVSLRLKATQHPHHTRHLGARNEFGGSEMGKDNYTGKGMHVFKYISLIPAKKFREDLRETNAYALEPIADKGLFLETMIRRFVLVESAIQDPAKSFSSSKCANFRRLCDPFGLQVGTTDVTIGQLWFHKVAKRRYMMGKVNRQDGDPPTYIFLYDEYGYPANTIWYRKRHTAFDVISYNRWRRAGGHPILDIEAGNPHIVLQSLNYLWQVAIPYQALPTDQNLDESIARKLQMWDDEVGNGHVIQEAAWEDNH